MRVARSPVIPLDRHRRRRLRGLPTRPLARASASPNRVARALSQ